MALKAQKIQLDPNNNQKTLIKKHFGYARIAYNAVHSEFMSELKKDNWLSLYDLKKIFNARKRDAWDWAGELSQNAAKNAMHNFNDAVTRWVKKQNKFPKKKRKKSHNQSYTASNGRNSVRIEGKRIQLPKIGWVRMHEELKYEGDIMRVTISERAGRYFVSILIETQDEDAPDLRGLPAVGVDVGINSLAVTDDGTHYENARALRRYKRKLRRSSKKLSRRQYLSQNWYKAKSELARLHYRIACIRLDNHHKVSTDIVKRAGIIGIESLRVSGLMKNRKLSKALSDAALYTFLTMIKYKAKARGIPIVEADRFYPSTKTCSECREKNKDITLADRTFVCPSCGFTCDRDTNAAINLKKLAVSFTESLNDCGQDVSPALVQA